MSNQNNEAEQKARKSAADMTSADKAAWTEKVIKKYAYGSIAVGLVPIPLIDLIALTGLQVKLIHKLSTFYGVPFSEERTKNIIVALAGASVPLGLTRAFCSILKIVPVLGFTASAISMSALSAASTYAIGKVFVRHFESGGTFLSFNITKAKDYYEEQVKKGKEFAEELKKTNTEV
jgi:uncharacterized protein (DUF697 family)